MKSLIFSTGNSQKFLTAQHVCQSLGIELVQKNLDVTEIQDEDPEKVALDKAEKAFALTGQPTVITDDSWAFHGLNGFPGVYMHSMNEWFTPEDFLRLTKPLKNREVTLTQYLVYVDAKQQKVFTVKTKGRLLSEIKGTSAHPSHTIMTIEGDNGLSIAEVYNAGKDKSKRRPAKVWHDFTKWYLTQED